MEICTLAHSSIINTHVAQQEWRRIEWALWHSSHIHELHAEYFTALYVESFVVIYWHGLGGRQVYNIHTVRERFLDDVL